MTDCDKQMTVCKFSMAPRNMQTVQASANMQKNNQKVNLATDLFV